MNGWGVFSNSNDAVCRKKQIFVKLIYSIKTNLITSFFSKSLVKFLRNSIEYVVSKVDLGALLDAIKVAVLTAMTIQSTF